VKEDGRKDGKGGLGCECRPSPLFKPPTPRRRGFGFRHLIGSPAKRSRKGIVSATWMEKPRQEGDSRSDLDYFKLKQGRPCFFSGRENFFSSRDTGSLERKTFTRKMSPFKKGDTA